MPTTLLQLDVASSIIRKIHDQQITIAQLDNLPDHLKQNLLWGVTIYEFFFKNKNLGHFPQQFA
jgi:hypothetical protein